MKNLSPQGINGGTFDVTAFGALPDGSAAGQAAWNAAITAANTWASTTSQAVLYVPPGRYRIDDTVTIKANVKVMAYGAYVYAGGTWTGTGATTKQMFNGVGSGTYTGGPHGFEWHGGIIDAKAQNWSTGVDFDIIRAGNCRGLVFKDITFRNVASYHSLDFEAVDGAVVQGCRFEGFDDNSTGGARGFSEAVQIDMDDTDFTGSINIVVVDNYMGPAIDGSGLGSYGCFVGSHTGDTGTVYSGIRVANNTIDDPGDVGIHTACWFDSTITGNVITGGTYGIKAQPAVFSADQTSQRVTITGNVIKQATNAGMYLNGDPSRELYNYTITGNTVISTNSQSQGAINCDQLHDSVISGNTVQMGTSGSGDGIYLRNSNDTVVSSNNIKGAASGGGYGISVLGCTRCTFNDNRLRRVNKSGIRFESGTVSSQCKVTDNFIAGAGAVTDATYFAIELTNAAHADNAFSGNVIRLNGSGNEVSSFYSVGAGVTGSYFGVDETYSVARTSDFTGTSTSYASVTSMSLAIPSPGNYRVQVGYEYQVSGAAGNALGFTGPSVATVSYHDLRQVTSSGSSTMTTGGAFENNTSNQTAPTASTRFGGWLNGYFQATAAGTLQLRYKTAAATLTLYSGSTMMVERLAG